MGKIYLQMYSFMDGKHNDTRESIRLASEMGYDGVELFGANFDVPAEEMKELLDKYGLDAVSMHVPDTDTLEDFIPYAKTVGARFIGISMEPMKDEEAVHAWARRLNKFGESCKKEGLTMIYHNHTQEFAPCGDARIIDVLLDETDPELVSFELDAGWCAAAGADPIEHVKRYSGRIKLLHVKESEKVIGAMPYLDFNGFEKDENGRPILPQEVRDMLAEAKKINCAACEGLVDWKKMTEAADANGCCAHIVERESDHGDRIEELKNDIKRYREVM